MILNRANHLNKVGTKAMVGNPRNAASAYSMPVSMASSIASANWSTSSTVVYTFGVTRSPWNSAKYDYAAVLRAGLDQIEKEG